MDCGANNIPDEFYTKQAHFAHRAAFCLPIQHWQLIQFGNHGTNGAPLRGEELQHKNPGASQDNFGFVLFSCFTRPPQDVPSIGVPVHICVTTCVGCVVEIGLAPTFTNTLCFKFAIQYS